MAMGPNDCVTKSVVTPVKAGTRTNKKGNLFKAKSGASGKMGNPMSMRGK